MIALVFAITSAVMVPPKPTAQDARDIQHKCHVPRSWVNYHNGALHIAPPKTASDQQINCILAEATKNFPRTGWVGNETR